MRDSADLVGRADERAHLIAALDRARAGHGSLVLVAGEAGVGKTRLAASLVDDADATVLRGRATQGAAQPYGLLVSAFRSHLRVAPDAFAGLGRLKEHLAALLPEVGKAAPASDRGTLFEAIRCALAHLAEDRLAVLVLDDLHWSDIATLELLGGLAEPLTDLSVVVVATYRSDGLPRGHGLRRLRNDLRRAGLLEELTLEPLTLEQTGEMLTAMLGAALDPALVRAVHDRTMGVPFFVEELARALGVNGVLSKGSRGLSLATGDEVPLPDTVRDAVLLGITDLSDDARTAADTAAVAGERFEIELVARVCGDAAVAELLEHGLVEEAGAGWGCFNHALSRESVYSDIPWLRRRRLHNQIAELMEERGAPASLLATQWIAAREPVKARAALMQAASEFEAAFAYRDAAEAGREALDLWDEAPDDGRRIEALERYARCSELAGDVSEAVRAWRELTDVLERAGDGPGARGRASQPGARP